MTTSPDPLEELIADAKRITEAPVFDPHAAHDLVQRLAKLDEILEYDYCGADYDGSPDTAGFRAWGSKRAEYAAYRAYKRGPWRKWTQDGGAA